MLKRQVTEATNDHRVARAAIGVRHECGGHARAWRVSFACALGMALAFVPARGQTGPADPAGPDIDRDAVELLAAVEAKMRAADAIEVTRWSTLRRPDGEAAGSRVLRVHVKRPNQYRIETIELDEEARKQYIPVLRVTDGRTRLTKRLDPDGNRRQFVEHTADVDIHVWDDDVQTLAGLFVVDDEHPGIGHDWRTHKLYEPNLRSVRTLGAEEWNGETHTVIEWQYDVGYYLPEDQVRYRQRIYVGPDTIVRRVVTRTSRGAELEDQIRSITLDPELPDDLFHVPPNQDSTPLSPPYRSNFTVGDILPDFLLETPTGQPISQSGTLEGTKGALLWLWAFRCGTCHVEFPLVEQMWKELRPQGLAVVALAGHSPADTVRIIQEFHRSELPFAVVPDASDSTSVFGVYGSSWRT